MADRGSGVVAADDRFRLMVEAHPYAIVLVDENGIIISVNAQAEASFGYARHALLGQPVELLIPPAARVEHTALRRAYAAAPAQRAMGAWRDLWARRQDGSVFPAEILLNPIHTEAGPAVMAVVVDISERKSVAASLQGALSLQAAIVASASDAIVSQTADGVITSWNPGAERLFGYSAAEALGRTIADLIAPAAYAIEERRSLAQIAATGKVVHFETERRRKDGSMVEVAVALSPIRDVEGRVVGYSAVKRDLSARRREEARLRMVVEAAPAALLVVNHSGVIEMANAHAERVFGCPRQELVGTEVERLLPDRLRSAAPFDSRSFLQTDAYRTDGELRVRRADGVEIPVEAGLNPIETADGPMLLAVISDISERVESARRLASQRSELQRSNEALSTFAYVASHDLKSPLRAVFQLATWIEQDVTEGRFDALPGYIKLLHGRLRRMEVLLDDLLAYARAGDSRGGLSRVAVAALARGMFDTEMPPTGLRLELAADLPEFTTWAAPFAQVLRNLFANAIKHHDRGEGSIHLACCTTPQGRYEFSVTDDGPGIPRQYHDKVFAMFQTLRPRDEVEGSGMGLALVKKIIEGFGGRIWIHPREDRGCSVRFTWPANPSEVPNHEHSATP